MAAECWVAIPNHEGLYAVSDFGRIISFHGRGRLLRHSHFSGSNQYPFVRLNKNGNTKTVHVHTLVANSFLGPTPVGKEVNHKDGVKANCCLSNLEYVTRQENIKHAYRVGLAHPVIGNRNGASKLTASEIIEIRRLYAAGIKSPRLASMFKVGTTSILNIVNRKLWRHI